MQEYISTAVTSMKMLISIGGPNKVSIPLIMHVILHLFFSLAKANGFSYLQTWCKYIYQTFFAVGLGLEKELFCKVIIH
jgi:hypothetical protein